MYSIETRDSLNEINCCFFFLNFKGLVRLSNIMPSSELNGPNSIGRDYTVQYTVINLYLFKYENKLYNYYL